MQFTTNRLLWIRTADWRSHSYIVLGRILKMKVLVTYQLERNLFVCFDMRENTCFVCIAFLRANL